LKQLTDADRLLVPQIPDDVSLGEVEPTAEQEQRCDWHIEAACRKLRERAIARLPAQAGVSTREYRFEDRRTMRVEEVT
jgi:hypothetical protein